MLAALRSVTGAMPRTVWHQDTKLPKSDFIVLPGGFSHGDYLRAGAIAARAPIMKAVAAAAKKGVPVLGICNGFQLLTEARLLPGALLRNAGLTFVCREVRLSIENTDNPFLHTYNQGEIIRCPVAHHDGNYFADEKTLKTLEGDGRVALRYTEGTNPNGSINDIAGILNERGNVLGMMPHFENLVEDAQGGTDGRRLFEAALDAVAAA
jgi:phosphoribosylformylglycinamidine synthase